MQGAKLQGEKAKFTRGAYVQLVIYKGEKINYLQRGNSL